MAGENAYPRRVGRGMVALAAVLVLALLTWAFSGMLAEQRNPNRRVAGELIGEVRQVVLDANRQHHYLAMAEINGAPVEVMVDTGASQVAVSRRAADRLGLPYGRPGVVSTANGSARVHATLLGSVRLGNITIENVTGVIVPNMDAPEVLLGMSFLRELEMIQRDGRLILRQAPAGG